MWGTCKIVNFYFSWLLFATLMIGQNLLTQKNTCTLSRWGLNTSFYHVYKWPFCRFMHSLCKNENIPMWGKHLVHKKSKSFLPYPDDYLMN